MPNHSARRGCTENLISARHTRASSGSRRIYFDKTRCMFGISSSRFLFVYFVASWRRVCQRIVSLFRAAFCAASKRHHPIKIRGSLERNTPMRNCVRCCITGAVVDEVRRRRRLQVFELIPDVAHVRRTEGIADERVSRARTAVRFSRIVEFRYVLCAHRRDLTNSILVTFSPRRVCG